MNHRYQVYVYHNLALRGQTVFEFHIKSEQFDWFSSNCVLSEPQLIDERASLLGHMSHLNTFPVLEHFSSPLADRRRAARKTTLIALDFVKTARGGRAGSFADNGRVMSLH